MKTTYLAPALALTLISGLVNAGNTVTVDTQLQVYVAKGVTADSGAALRFPDVVVPESGTGTITLDPSDNSIVYSDAALQPSTNAATPTANSGGQNAVTNVGIAQTGLINIQGEPNYAVMVTISSTEAMASRSDHMSYAPTMVSGGATVPATNVGVTLDGMGDATVKFGGELTIAATFDQTANDLTLDIQALVSYY